MERTQGVEEIDEKTNEVWTRGRRKQRKKNKKMRQVEEEQAECHLNGVQGSWSQLARAGGEGELGAEQSVGGQQRVLGLDVPLILQDDLARSGKSIIIIVGA